MFHFLFAQTKIFAPKKEVEMGGAYSS